MAESLRPTGLHSFVEAIQKAAPENGAPAVDQTPSVTEPPLSKSESVDIPIQLSADVPPPPNNWPPTTGIVFAPEAPVVADFGERKGERKDVTEEIPSAVQGEYATPKPRPVQRPPYQRPDGQPLIPRESTPSEVDYRRRRGHRKLRVSGAIALIGIGAVSVVEIQGHLNEHRQSITQSIAPDQDTTPTATVPTSLPETSGVLPPVLSPSRWHSEKEHKEHVVKKKKSAPSTTTTSTTSTSTTTIPKVVAPITLPIQRTETQVYFPNPPVTQNMDIYVDKGKAVYYEGQYYLGPVNINVASEISSVMDNSVTKVSEVDAQFVSPFANYLAAEGDNVTRSSPTSAVVANQAAYDAFGTFTMEADAYVAAAQPLLADAYLRHDNDETNLAVSQSIGKRFHAERVDTTTIPPSETQLIELEQQLKANIHTDLGAQVLRVAYTMYGTHPELLITMDKGNTAKVVLVESDPSFNPTQVNKALGF